MEKGINMNAVGYSKNYHIENSEFLVTSNRIYVVCYVINNKVLATEANLIFWRTNKTVKYLTWLLNILYILELLMKL